MALTPKESRFVAEYLVDQNGSRAARAAGYAVKSASVIASKLLAKAKVRDAVDAAMARREARVEVKQDDVLRVLFEALQVDVGEAFDAKGKLLPLRAMPERVRRCIQSIGSDGTVRFMPKERAAELLGKHLRMFAEKIEVSGRLTLEQLVLASNQVQPVSTPPPTRPAPTTEAPYEVPTK